MASGAGVGAAGYLSFSTNEVFRGESVSEDSPAVTAAVSLDHGSGFFGGGSATVAVAKGNGDRLATATQHAGFAVRRSATSFEIGVIHRSYGRIVDTDYNRQFIEGYVGVSGRTISTKLFVSPNYRRDGRATYYGQIDARLFTVHGWSGEAHVGLSLIPEPSGRSRDSLHYYRDWRVRLSRPIGRLNFTIGAAGTNYPVYAESGRVRFSAAFGAAF